MLRITIHNEAAMTRFIVEGKLTGAWVDELSRCWRMVTAEMSLPVTVDLSAMTFIDSKGKELLTEMHQHGVRLAAVGLMTQAILEEITR